MIYFILMTCVKFQNHFARPNNNIFCVGLPKKQHVFICSGLGSSMAHNNCDYFYDDDCYQHYTMMRLISRANAAKSFSTVRIFDVLDDVVLVRICGHNENLHAIRPLRTFFSTFNLECCYNNIIFNMITSMDLSEINPYFFKWSWLFLTDFPMFITYEWL